MTRRAACVLCLATLLPSAASAPAAVPRIERVTTAVPFPRGLAMVGDDLYVLCRGRVRGAGGVSAAVEDQAGTVYVIDADIAEPVERTPVGAAVRANGTVFARPASPPFLLWDRGSDPPQRDRRTDRPYCTLRYHDATRSFYLCAFSGVDLPRTPDDPVAFSKNFTDAILRYDLRTRRWHEVERHDRRAGAVYPHADPQAEPPPHGWLKGPDNCLPLGESLYAVAKDNSLLVRYDLSALVRDPRAGPPAGEVVLGADVAVAGLGRRRYRGHSALAFRDGHLYVGCRTSSVILRLRLDEAFQPVRPVEAQLVARFEPYDPRRGRSADLTDMDFDDRGRLYVISASPARIYRFAPDPQRVFDGRPGRAGPWVDLAARTGNPRMKIENLLVHDGRVYVTSGDGYGYQDGAHGTVYRVGIPD